MNIQTFKIRVLPIREKLYRRSLKMLGSEADAEDMTQEVMLKLWMMRSRLEEYRSIEALAVQICKNACINKIRARKIYVNEAFDFLQVSVPTPDRQLEEIDSVETVARIIDRLPEMQKLTIRLRDIEGYQPEEIAEITGCAESAVRVNLSRARKKVKEEFFKINNFELS